jgi:hypothetical protein
MKEIKSRKVEKKEINPLGMVLKDLNLQMQGYLNALREVTPERSGNWRR